MAKIVCALRAKILATVLLLASSVAADLCVYPDKPLATCVKEDVAVRAKDCPARSAQMRGGGKFYATISECCKSEFGGKCKEYTDCVYPDKNMGTCIKSKVDFSPRDCPPLSANAGGKGSYYGDLADCCAKEFGGKCKDYSNCVYPDKSKGTCIPTRVEFSPRDCPLLSARAGGKGSYYGDFADCCAKEFGGKCASLTSTRQTSTTYTDCALPDKATSTCVLKKVEFAPRDCLALSERAGGMQAGSLLYQHF